MTEVPKIVHDRLLSAERALRGQTAIDSAHPDADLLTAFAEQALRPAERDGLFEHLAFCKGCRDMVALALPAEEFTAGTSPVGTSPVRSAPIPTGAVIRWLTAFTGPSLRWAVLAAGIAIVGAVLVERPGTQNQAKLPPANLQDAVTAAPAAFQSTASLPTAQPLLPGANADRRLELNSPKKLRAGKIAAGKIAAPAPNPGLRIGAPEIMVAGNQGNLIPPASLTGLGAAEPAASAGANPPEWPPLSGGDTLMAENEAPPIERAKPALQTAESAQQRNVTWKVAGGVLQKSLDSGQSWQQAVQANNPLLCYAVRNQDVWTGGRAGTLLHSADGGVTWVQVQPLFNAHPLTLDITYIDLPNQSLIVASNGNNEIWSSADGGETWEKK